MLGYHTTSNNTMQCSVHPSAQRGPYLWEHALALDHVARHGCCSRRTDHAEGHSACSQHVHLHAASASAALSKSGICTLPARAQTPVELRNGAMSARMGALAGLLRVLGRMSIVVRIISR